MRQLLPSLVAEANLNLLHPRLIQYCTNTKDFMVPSMWGSVSRQFTYKSMINGALR